MKIRVLSRMVISDPDKLGIPDRPFAVVSFNDGEERAPMTNWLEVLPTFRGMIKFSVHDVDSHYIADKYSFMAFSEADAKRLLAWIDRLPPDTEELFFQCGAGISRSSGAAAAVAYILNGSDREIFDNSMYLPNMLIYRAILKEHFCDLWKPGGGEEALF